MYKKVTKNKHSQIKTLLHMFSDPPPPLLLLILILISRHSETLLPPLLRAPCAHQLWQHCLPTNCALALQIRERAYKICSASILQNRFRFIQSFFLIFSTFTSNNFYLITYWTIYFLILYHS